MHLVPLDTCAYFFDFGAPDEEARKFSIIYQLDFGHAKSSYHETNNFDMTMHGA
jgi:hypothetical protein